MKEQGILFAGEMVRAILNTKIGDEPGPVDPAKPWKCVMRRLIKPQPDPMFEKAATGVVCRFKVGQTLWVRETFQSAKILQQCIAGDWVYQADNIWHTKWRPSIFMPRIASRIDLRVVSVRAERLHDITEEDAEREGVKPTPEMDMNWALPCSRLYRDLWNLINGPGSWDSNLWVWRVEFRRTK